MNFFPRTTYLIDLTVCTRNKGSVGPRNILTLFILWKHDLGHLSLKNFRRTGVSLINRWCPGLSRRCQVEFSITCRATKFSPRAAIVPYPFHVERFNVSPWAECGDRILSDLVQPYPFLATVLCKLIVAQETSKSWKLDVAVPLQSDGTISSRTSFWEQWQSEVIYSQLGACNCPS